MTDRGKDSSAAKQARTARREAKRATRASGSGTSGSRGPGTWKLPFPNSSHIKNRTQGTSNEISFSVLDAMKNSSTDVTKKAHGVASTPRTMAEVAAEQARDDAHAALRISSSTEDSARRKVPHLQPRMRRIALLIGAGACALALVIGMGVAIATFAGEEEPPNPLTQPLSIIEEADDALFSFDDLVVGTMNATLPEMIEQDIPTRYEESTPVLSVAEDHMTEASRLIEQAQPQLSDSADLQAAHRVREALAAREALIETGEEAMDQTATVLDLYERVEVGWNDLLESDALARDAAVLSTYTTLATLQTALDKTDEAIAAFEAVRAQFVGAQQDIAEQRAYLAQVQTATQEGADGLQSGAPADSAGTADSADSAASLVATPEPATTAAAPESGASATNPTASTEAPAQLATLDGILAHYLEYIDLRLQAQDEAKRSTQALIDHDAATAQAANNAYNQLDSRAVTLIRGNVEQPTQHVTKYFDLIRENLFSPYVQARARASEADAYLGDYLESLGR